MGQYPMGQLIEGFDGKLYGTATNSGFAEFSSGFEGSVFRVNKDGSNFVPLWKFGAMPYDGSNSFAGVVLGSDGSLYGTTYVGGSNNLGTVFRLTSAGNNGYTNKILKSFTGLNGDGANPSCKLILGFDGWLYGTTYNGGSNNVGVLFKLQTNGTSFTILHTFSTASTDSANPFAGVIQGTNGLLFGVSSNGAASGHGAIFRISTNGTGYTNLRSFNGATTDGAYPVANLVCDTNNVFYGVTLAGGANNLGTAFKINGDGTGYAVIANFTGSGGAVPGAQPRSCLIIARDGMLYGTTELGGATSTNNDGTVFRLNKNGSGYTVLHTFSFSLNNNDGSDPQGGLLQGSDGGIYGTAFNGGRNEFGTPQQGTIFSLGLIPPNDAFANRFSLIGPDAVAAGYNLNATLEINEPPHSNVVMTLTPQAAVGTNSIWWSWSGLPNGLVTIVDDANTVDAIIDVYTNRLPSGLVNWWRGENNGLDSAGPNNGFLSNGLAFASGMMGQAFSFDGIDDYLQIGAPAISPPWSAEFWVNRQATTNDSAVLLGDFATALKLEQYQNTKRVGYTIWNVADYSFNYTAPIGTWVHLVFVGSTSNIELFANGISQGTIATNWTLPRGTIGYDVARGNKKQLKGLLDEISLYNRMLTPGEIQALYTAGKTNLTDLFLLQSSTAAHIGLSNRVSFFANPSATYQIAVSGTVDENMGPTFAGSGPISLSMRTLDLSLLSISTTSNANSTITFTNGKVQIGNAGTVPRGPLRVEVIAQPGFSIAASSNAGIYLPPERLLGTFDLTNPPTLAPGAMTTNISIFGLCPAPTNYIFAGTTNSVGWGVFAQLEEQVGTNWFVKDKDLVLYSVWPTTGGFSGPGGGVVRINPTGTNTIVHLLSTTIQGPAVVNEGTTNQYTGFVRFSDGGTFTFSNTVWTASLFSITTNGLFAAGSVNNDTPVTLSCYYIYDNKTNNAATNVTVLNLPPPRLTNFTVLPTKQVQFTINGVPGRLHVIEAATNLNAPTLWTALATSAVSPGGTLIFTDPAAPGLTRRFYRAHEQ
jgi:uncharacterized repeat protein (TIGR03803 family)